MKQTAAYLLTALAWIVVLSVVAEAGQQSVNPNRPAARGARAGQEPAVNPARAQKQEQKAEQKEEKAAQKSAGPTPAEIRKALEDAAPKRTAQQSKLAGEVVARYIGRLQSEVGLSADQTDKLSPRLQQYIQRQLMLADRKANIYKILDQADPRGSADDLQKQVDLLDLTDTQLNNATKQFFTEVDPQLTVAQRTRLRIYLKETGQKIQQMIQETAK